jgi:Taurine catabolism dioxygenase TauD, TfdA family
VQILETTLRKYMRLIQAIMYGDGKLLNEEHVLGTAAIMEEICVAFKWTKGDVVWIDNNQVMHSRRAGYTPPRKIMAVLTANCPYE